MTQHSPTPWTYNLELQHIRDKNGNGVGSLYNAKDDVAAIRAVNRDHAFDALMEAVDDTRILIDYLKRQYEIAGTLDGVNMKHVFEIEPTIRAALALAKGGV